MKLKDPKFALRTEFGYTIHTAVVGQTCRGISLLVWEDGLFGIKEVKV